MVRKLITNLLYTNINFHNIITKNTCDKKKKKPLTIQFNKGEVYGRIKPTFILNHLFYFAFL